MRSLTDETVLRVWEVGARQHPIDLALTILGAALPEMRRDRLATLSVGHRDAVVLSVRRATFGPTLRGYVECPACGERLEFEMETDGLRAGAYPDPGDEREPPVEAFTVDGYAVRFRLPDSGDLAAIAAAVDAVTARQTLARRCVVEVAREGTAVAFDDLPDGAIAELARRIVERDPQAEVLLDLLCPACDGRWQAPFDVVAFFWAELAVEAKRLLREVHALARGYGWREVDVLAMTAWRRRHYLDLLEA